MNHTWMLYGAYGFTGQLIVDEALQRGHRPLLAGRSPEKLLPLAERFGLESLLLDLSDPRTLRQALENIELVLHAAGPYVETSLPMLSACLDTRTHYVDITGELPVFQQTFAHDGAARQAGVCLLSGAGYDVVPTDCLAAMLAQRLPGATHLELAISGGGGGVSAGTLKSSIGIFAGGGMQRRGGELVPVPVGSRQRRIAFDHGEQISTLAPLGDLVTAYASTGIPDITTYMAAGFSVALTRPIIPLLHRLLQNEGLRARVEALAQRIARGPNRQAQHAHRSHAWGRVTDDNGSAVEGTLNLPEPYRFTALSSVRAVERLLETHPAGALTPSQALGMDFVLSIQDVEMKWSAPLPV